VDGWVGVKAVLRIAYSNQKLIGIQSFEILRENLMGKFELDCFIRNKEDYFCITLGKS
jgi:hypothetical protein